MSDNILPEENEINFPAPPENIANKLRELNSWRVERQNLYILSIQLEKLYDDIDAGLFGEDVKTGEFYTYIKGIKNDIPKPDVATIQAELDALIAEQEE